MICSYENLNLKFVIIITNKFLIVRFRCSTFQISNLKIGTVKFANYVKERLLEFYKCWILVLRICNLNGFHGHTIFIKFADIAFSYWLWSIIRKVMACTLAVLSSLGSSIVCEMLDSLLQPIPRLKVLNTLPIVIWTKMSKACGMTNFCN
jgi:hypothetical protein